MIKGLYVFLAYRPPKRHDRYVYRSAEQKWITPKMSIDGLDSTICSRLRYKYCVKHENNFSYILRTQCNLALGSRSWTSLMLEGY